MNDLRDDDEIVLKVEKDPLIGQMLGGRYKIVSVLGRGGMGVVYKAHQADIDRYVAVKTLHVSKVIDGDTIKRFQSEAQAVSRVRHPNTVMLYDFGVSDGGVPYLVMELLEGVSFRDVLKTEGSLSLARASRIFQQVLSALGFAHDAGIVHRDMKPENIMLSQRGGEDWVYVLDFGIAGMMGADAGEQIVGSPPYMSPEQCSMQDADPRSDFYSLAIVIFEALSGKLPYQARSAMEIIECHISGQPKILKDLGTSTATYESISAVIARAMEKRPDKRYPNAAAFSEELEDAFNRDSKRGLALKHRVDLDAPRVNEFANLNKVVLKELSDDQDEGRRKHFSKKNKSFMNGIRTFFQGDAAAANQDRADKSGQGGTDSQNQQNYQFLNCPHCDTPTQEGLNLCLSCGRSLASKNDYSKLRVAKGDFSLPKYQDNNSEAAPSSSRVLSQKSRKAMISGGQTWTRSSGLALMTLLLIVCVIFMAGGSKYLNMFLGNKDQSSDSSSSGEVYGPERPSPSTPAPRNSTHY